MEKHNELSDDEFMQAFSTCTLSPEIFNHEAHLRLAWIHIRMFGLKKAEENIQVQLQSFVAHAGVQDKYNKTVTLVAIKAIDHFMKRSNATSFKNFIEQYSVLKSDFKGIIESHYSFDIFDSDKAKDHFLQPDLLPFD